MSNAREHYGCGQNIDYWQAKILPIDGFIDGTWNDATDIFYTQCRSLGFGDVAITGSKPVENDWISIYDSVYFSVEVVNNFQQQSPARVVNWHVCEGVKVANQCIGSAVDDGSITIPPLIPFNVQEFTSTNSFSPNGYNGNMTVVYQFDQMDQNPTDDVFVFVINSTNEYTDLKIDTDYDILSVLSNLPEDNGQLIINADTNYSLI